MTRLDVSALKEAWGKSRAVRSRNVPKVEDPLRPSTWKEFIGHEDAKRLVRSTIEAAKRREEAPSSALLWGPPGTGKTALGVLAAIEFGNSRHFPAIGLEQSELKQAVSRVGTGLIFIDDIDALSKDCKVALFPIIDRGIVNKGNREEKVDVAIWGSTNEPGRLPRALRSRFSLEVYVGPYGERDMQKIIEQAVGTLGLDLEDEGIKEVSQVSRGRPRLAMRVLKRARDINTIEEVEGEDLVRQAAEDLGFGMLGLLKSERQYLFALKELGGSTGVSNLSSVLNLSNSAVKELEPELLRRGYVRISSRGRELTPDGWELFI